MNDDEALRDLLGKLADNPPLVLGRKEAVMSRISRRTQRQALMRSASAFGVVAALTLGGFTTQQTLFNTGSDGPDQVQTEPAHEPTGSPVPRTEPTHSVAPPTTDATHEPSPTSEPTHHESPAPSSESTAATGPLTLSVTMDPATAPKGTTVHAKLVARDGAGALKHVHIEWGDGTVTDFSPSGDPGCRTTHLDGDFTHTYSTAGTMTVHVTVTSGDACSAEESVTKESHVTITGGDQSPSPSPSCTNGPSNPVATGTPYTVDGSTEAHVNGKGVDSDGVIHKIQVNWGDGSTSTSQLWTSGESHDQNFGHHFATTGDYTVTITVWSTDCNGGTVQEASTQVVVHQP